MPQLAQVAISAATPSYDKLYTYMVPAPLEGHIFVGSMVLVPFGRGAAKPRTGVIIALEQGEATARVKSLFSAAPEDARLTDELLAIVRYLKEATLCTWYDAVRAVIPYGALYKPVQTEQGWALQKQLRRHTETVYFPGAAPEKPTAKQQAVLDYVAITPHTRREIEAACGVGRGVVDTLVKKGALQAEEQDKQVEIQGLVTGEEYEVAGELKPQPPLSPAQQQVADALSTRMAQPRPKPALLHGVTGSGKTAVFLSLVQSVLDKGKTALVLVPEIGLTPQMLSALRAAFGRQVAVQHSALSNTERLLQWRQIQRGEAPVVVGTRSAVFAPLENIGIVVVDEEHERSYQSESPPRYDALEVARRRAAHHGALLLMASATPSVADYYTAQQGRYDLFRLEQRYGNLPLPKVEMVDMRNELNPGTALSTRLAEEIAANMECGSQTILLLNRRGYHRVGVCRSCNEAIKCVNCSVPLVHHKNPARLMCHYCGHTVQPAPELCPACGGEIRYAGFGTQRLEDELAERFPTARVLRMDMDSTSRKGAHAQMLGAFGRGEYDILLGTQMVAKGLDFEKVSLVGVIGIDSLLFSQGYRAYETVFSLVTQVVGRSGRAGSPGRALIQTNDPDNPVLALAARQDYEAFYEQEIAFRKLALYPPFCSICAVGFTGRQEGQVIVAARRFSAILAGLAKQRPNIPLRILGPAPLHVAQVAGIYRWRLTLKCRNSPDFRALAMQALEAYNREGQSKTVPVSFDFHSDTGS